MKASYQCWKDVSKYFLETYIRIPETGTTDWWFVRSVTTEGMVVRHAVTLEEGFISFESGSEYEIQNPLFDKNSWVLVKGKAFFVCRRPARMWRKGVCHENTLMFGINDAGEMRPVQFDVKILQEVGKHEVSELPGKLTEDLLVDRRTVVHKKTGVVFYKDFQIARISGTFKKMFVPREYSNFSFPQLLNNVPKEYL